MLQLPAGIVVLWTMRLARMFYYTLPGPVAVPRGCLSSQETRRANHPYYN